MLRAGKLPLMTRLRLLFCIFLFAASSFAEDEEVPLYQVEIIVFQHVFSDELPEEASQVNDYRMVTRPLPLPIDEPELVEDEAESVVDGESETRQDSFLQRAGDLDVWPPAVFDPLDFEILPEDEIQPDLIFEVAQLSETMQQAWNRLQNSAGYEPLKFAGWQQHAYPPEVQVPVRIHDEVPLPDPDAFVGPPDELLAMVGANIDTEPAVATEAEETEAEAEEEIDEAEFTSYRLDGQFSLVQRRFLHLDIDLEYREQAGHPPIRYAGEALEQGDEPGLVAEELPGWLLHTVLQRRQVHEDRFEYFDTPWLGVLALVTEVEIPEEPEESEPPVENGNVVQSNSESRQEDSSL